MEAVMKNKLSNLGFLGVLGLAGFFGTPLLFSFLGFFVFFVYEKIIPDELFWANVRVSATRGFFTFLIPSCVIVVATVLLQKSEMSPVYSFLIFQIGFSLAMAASLFMFCVTLEYLERKEKRSKDDGEES
jgi:preprotein translocase subunit SecG